MSDPILNDPNEALCYMVECTMASLEYNRCLARYPKREILRLEAIIRAGLRTCRDFNLKGVAEHTRCGRVVKSLEEAEKVGHLS